MRRREFIAGLGSAAAWLAMAQQSAMRVVGLLGTASREGTGVAFDGLQRGW
jgi:hypothetical protein